MQDFRGKTAFITGGASGIGLGMARAFGHAGMNVVLADIDEKLARTLDIARRELVDPDGVVMPLSSGEFRLLRAFVEHPQRVLTREQLLDYAFNNDADVFDRAVDVQVSRLRKKLERPGGVEIIRTVRGEGYLFAVKPSA